MGPQDGSVMPNLDPPPKVGTHELSYSPGDCRHELLQSILHRIHKAAYHCLLVASFSFPMESSFGLPATMAAFQETSCVHRTQIVCHYQSLQWPSMDIIQLKDPQRCSRHIGEDVHECVSSYLEDGVFTGFLKHSAYNVCCQEETVTVTLHIRTCVCLPNFLRKVGEWSQEE